MVAAICGVSPAAVTQWVKRSQMQSLPGGDIPVDEVRRMVELRYARNLPDDSKESADGADVRYKLGRAEKIELQNAELRGELRRHVDIVKTQRELGIRVRERVLAAGKRASPKVVGKGAREADIIIETELRKALVVLAEEHEAEHGGGEEE